MFALFVRTDSLELDAATPAGAVLLYSTRAEAEKVLYQALVASGRIDPRDHLKTRDGRRGAIAEAQLGLEAMDWAHVFPVVDRRRECHKHPQPKNVAR